jgi:hypothetical protein
MSRPGENRLNHHGLCESLITLAAWRLPSGFPSGLGGLLFESHWLVWLALAIVAAAFCWSGLRAGRPVLVRIGGVLAALVICWIGIAMLIDTPRERLINANEALVNAAAHNDVPGVMAFLAPEIVLGTWDRDQIQEQLENRFSQIHITGNFIRVLDVQDAGSTASVHLVVWTQTSDVGPFTTEWRLEWQDQSAPGNWQIIYAQLISMNDQPLPPNSGIPE